MSFKYLKLALFVVGILLECAAFYYGAASYARIPAAAAALGFALAGGMCFIASAISQQQ